MTLHLSRIFLVYIILLTNKVCLSIYINLNFNKDNGKWIHFFVEVLQLSLFIFFWESVNLVKINFLVRTIQHWIIWFYSMLSHEIFK